MELLEEKRLAVITHAVTKGLDPKAPLKDSGISWLGKVPEHWEVKQAKFALGRGEYGISETLGAEGRYGVLRMGDIGYGSVSTGNLSRIDDVDPSLLLRGGDLLFNRTNSYEQVAKVGLYRDEHPTDVTFASYLVRFRPTGSPAYFSYLLNVPQFLWYVRSFSLRAIGQVNLNPTRYSELEICVPPDAEQRTIADHLISYDAAATPLARKLHDSIDALIEYRSALITAAVTGKIAVPA